MKNGTVLFPLPMISVSQVIPSTTKLVSVKSVPTEVLINISKDIVPNVETEVLQLILYMVAIVVSKIISQLDHTVSVVHSTTDMNQLTQPDVLLVTQPVPNVTVHLKPIALLVTQMLCGLMTIQPLVCVKIMVVMIPINALQVGTMMLTEHIYVSEMNGLSEPIKEKPVDNSLLTQVLVMFPVVPILLLIIIMLTPPLMMDLAPMTQLLFQVALISMLPIIILVPLLMMDLANIHQNNQSLVAWMTKLPTIIH